MMIRKHLRDKAIPYQWVRIADETGALSAPRRTESVLTMLPQGHSLVMVAPPPPPSASDTKLQPSAAICRIVDAAAERAAAKAAAEVAAKESKKMAQHTKTLEINWAIAPNDLAHKMKRLDEFLGKGLRVDILFARKRGSRVATREEGQALVERVKEAAVNVPGATEYKKMDGQVGAVMRMFFEGPPNKKKAKKDTSEGKGIDGDE
jgi:translation initiation factor IF-3